MGGPNPEAHLVPFGLLEFNASSAFGYLRTDLKDEWFKDPLAYEDYFSDLDRTKNFIAKNLENGNGRYLTTKREEFNIPKKGFTLRYSLETHFFDRLVYQHLGTYLGKAFAAHISKRSFSHQLISNDIHYNSNRIFHNLIYQWQKFIEFVRIDSESKTILETDFQNFYENIKLDVLENDLKRLLAISKFSGHEKAKLLYCIESLMFCLQNWSYEPSRGLPQNRDVSSILANIYMIQLDNHMISKGYDYYRYMDDIRIITDNADTAKAALKELIVEARKIGLTVNGSKTKIIEPNSPVHPFNMPSQSTKLERLNSLLQSKRKPLVALAYMEMKENLEEMLCNQEHDEREFRFYINRMCRFALCKDLQKPKDFFSRITTSVIGLLDSQPQNSDKYIDYLMAVNLDATQFDLLSKKLMAKDKAIYSWQNYLIWKLLTFKEHDKQELHAHAVSQIETTNKAPDCAGALLYIGRFGTELETNSILENFSRFNSPFLQRHALIAIQGLKWKAVQQHISPSVREESLGTYRNLSQKPKKVYVAAPLKIELSELISGVSFYE